MSVSLTKEALAKMTDDPGPFNVHGSVKTIPKPMVSYLVFVGIVISQREVPS